jgi:hypothetical protein
MNDKPTVTIEIGSLVKAHLEIDLAMETERLIRFQKQGGWGAGINKAVEELLEAARKDLRAELEATLHKMILKKESIYGQ